MTEESINPDNLPVGSQELIDFLEKFKEIGEKISYRELNVESYYQELLEKTDYNDDEEFLFQVMAHNRETFIKIEESYQERRAQSPWLNTEMGKRLKTRYCDWDSRPIHQWEYHFKHTYFPKHVGQDTINGWYISTIWMGLDHSFWKDGDPIIFETMIFKDDESFPDNEEIKDYQERYSYLKEAEEGHKQACQRVREITKEMTMKSSMENPLRLK